MSKPSDLNAYFDVFVSEFQPLLMSGYLFNGVHYDILIHSFVCDLPARASVKYVKGHSGYFGCDRCHDEGQWHSKLKFQSTNAAPRMDAEFADQTDQDHHLGTSLIA